MGFAAAGMRKHARVHSCRWRGAIDIRERIGTGDIPHWCWGCGFFRSTHQVGMRRHLRHVQGDAFLPTFLSELVMTQIWRLPGAQGHTTAKIRQGKSLCAISPVGSAQESKLSEHFL